MSTTFSITSPFLNDPPTIAAPPPALLAELVQRIEQRTMMLFGAERRSHLLSTLVSRGRLVSQGDMTAYLQTVLSAGGETEFMTLIDSLTINETTFFRNVPQMNLFSKVVVPEIVAARRHDKGIKRLNIWSAACSSGQEAYTLAILAYEALRFTPAWDVRVFATDISPTVLEVARLGKYPKARLDTMPPEILRRYFDDLGDEIKVKDVLRKMITFQTQNLKDTFSPMIYDVIFCRNVMIYFSREDQAALVQRFRERLTPGGFLFIGHSESLHGLNVDLRLRLHEGGVTYQRSLA
jgi:chemotaxis protein methyltransferase CheR